MKTVIPCFAFAAFVFASCSTNSDNKKKYIDDTVVHEADSPIIPDRGMVPKPDTTDRNLDDPTTKLPD